MSGRILPWYDAESSAGDYDQRMSRSRRAPAEASDPDSDRRVPPRPRLVALSVLALLLQLPFAVFMATHDGAAALVDGVRIAAALLSPTIFLLCARWPGPRVAIIAGLTLVDIVVWAALARSSISGAWDHDVSNRPWSGDGPGGMWAQGLTGPEMTPFYAAFLFALVVAMVRGRQIWAIASAAGVWLGALLLGPFLGVEWSVGRVASATIGLIVALSIGAFARRRREGRRIADEEAQARHQEVIAAERLRIARDLHDVLGHSLSQINVQAGMGEHLIDRDPEQARHALAAIKELSRTGLNEVRSVLHTMRSDAVDGSGSGARAASAGGGTASEGSAEPLAPVPGLDDLPALIAAMPSRPAIDLDDRRELRADGTRTTPGSAADAAAYRIVQEALTNVVRHAHATSAMVEIFRENGFVRIDISDDGRGTDDAVFGRDDGSGTGIIGMRERAKLLHGTFTITSASAEGTHISVRLPWAGDDGRPSTGAQT
ncbi:sensor histidine kinase [Brevibacterium sandarakinum]|uniref:sensor histidine kinase n=1 Tax=Brevibacterium sandarakinum TaxID=629680 RepID=UPI00264C7CFF|nr:sensor histidine kinase [Brevibacterium sandarakinum]MDN5657563.1 sensor histidine kinase [Brevibacterium sandarakinum]